MHAESQVRGGALECISPLRRDVALLLGQSKPDCLDVAAGGIFGGDGIAECDGLNEMLVFFNQDSSIREALFEALLMKPLQTVPDYLPHLRQKRHGGGRNHRLVQLRIGCAKGGVIAISHRRI